MEISQTTSSGDIAKSSAYSLSEIPPVEPYSHIDLTQDKHFSGHCCIFDGKLYVRTGSFPKKGYLSCIDIKSGKVEWRREADFGQASQLIVEHNVVILGYLVFDRNTGETLFDIRDYYSNFEKSAGGFTSYENGTIFKSIDFKDPTKGLLSFNLNNKSIKVINPSISSYKPVGFCKLGLVCMSGSELQLFDFENEDLIWSVKIELDGNSIPSIAILDESIIIITENQISKFNLLDGVLINSSYLENDIPEHYKIRSFENVNMAANSSTLVVYRAGSVDSWMLIIDLDSWDISYFHKDRDIMNLSICGSMIVYSNSNNKIIGMDCRKKEKVWVSDEDITATSIVSNNNYLVVGAVISGFTVFNSHA